MKECESLRFFQAGYWLNFGCFRPQDLGVRSDRGHGDTPISGSLDKTLQFAIFVTFCHHGHDTCGAIFQDGSFDGMSSGKVTLLHNKSSSS